MESERSPIQATPTPEVTLRGEKISLSIDSASSATTAAIRQENDTRAPETGREVKISEFLRAPHELPLRWHSSSEGESLIFTAQSASIRINKRLSLPSHGLLVQLDYSFLNTGPRFDRPAFGLRLQLPFASELRWTVPTEAGMRSGPLKANREVRYLRPSAPWCGVASEARSIVMLFPDKILDAVEIRDDGSLFTISPLVYTLGLNPDCQAQFTCLIAFRISSPNGAGELLERHRSELRAGYGRVRPEGER